MVFASRRNRIALLAVLLAGTTGGACTKRRPGPSEPAAPAAGALAVVDGRVLTASGDPLGEATVRLEWDDPIGERSAERVPLATVRASDDGRFHIANVPPGRYRLRAHAPEHADGRVRIDVHAGESLATSVRLAQAETLKGQVVDRSGQPIPGARVLVWSLADPAERPRETISDDAGHFVLGGLTRGLHRLIAEAPGFGSIEQGPIEVPAAAPVLRMETDGHSITGLVTAGGHPAGGARVVIGGENLTPSRETRARGDGTFMLGGLGAGAYVLRAALGGEVSRLSPEIVLDRSGDRPPAIKLELGPGWMVGGRVVDDAGHPLADAEVRVDALPGEDPLPEIVRTDGKGEWRAGPLAAGEYRLTPRQPGFVARRPAQLLMGASRVGGERPQILELVRGAEIEGRVVDAKGGGVAGATVRALVPGRDDLAVIADRLPLAAEAAGLPSGSGHALGRTRTTTTDSGGRFQLADMLPGRVFVEISRAGNVPYRSAALALQPAQRLELPAVSLRGGVALTGRVVDEGDAPVEGARVLITAAPGGKAGSVELGALAEVVAVTDRAGLFAASVVPGTRQVRVSAAGLQDQTQTVTVSAAVPPAPVILRLGRADAAVEGSAHDDQGRPIARARVLAWPVPAGGAPAGSDVGDGAAPLASATTDAGGHFQLARLPRGQVVVEVKHPQYPPTTETTEATLPPRTPVAIKVPMPGRIEGEVREKVTGAVVSNYRIEARGPDGRVAGATRKNGSSFVLSRLLPGRWTLDVRAPGYDAVERVVDVPSASGLGETSVRDLRVEIEPIPRN
jgi:protocatechuate 3,4-dioxygenase beta subunit